MGTTPVLSCISRCYRPTCQSLPVETSPQNVPVATLEGVEGIALPGSNDPTESRADAEEEPELKPRLLSQDFLLGETAEQTTFCSQTELPPASSYLIHNLDTDDSLDLCDEAKAEFATAFACLIDDRDHMTKHKRHL